jgi:hypothetical protein
MKYFKTAVILCGGKGSRLGELGKSIPKTFVKVQNRRILWYILNIPKRNSSNKIATNFIGTANMLEVVKSYKPIKSAVIVKTDKIYQNLEQKIKFKEVSSLGGHDIYSGNKAACEILTHSYFKSFFLAIYNCRIATTIYIKPLTLHPLYKKYKSKVKNSLKIWKNLVTAPVNPNMTNYQLNYAIKHPKIFDLNLCSNKIGVLKNS